MQNRRGFNPIVRDALYDMGGDDAVYLDGYDNAVIGLTTEGAVVYDYNKMVECLVEQDGMTADAAAEWIDYNAIRALPYAPAPTPVIVYPLEGD